MSLKSVRLQKILELIEKNRIDTQEQLQQLLRDRKISRQPRRRSPVTSRSWDWSRFRMVKETIIMHMVVGTAGNLEKKYHAVFMQSLLSVDYAGAYHLHPLPYGYGECGPARHWIRWDLTGWSGPLRGMTPSLS